MAIKNFVTYGTNGLISGDVSWEYSNTVYHNIEEAVKKTFSGVEILHCLLNWFYCGKNWSVRKRSSAHFLECSVGNAILLVTVTTA
jgi:hypothetical protein